jgi:hypothetical protein
VKNNLGKIIFGIGILVIGAGVYFLSKSSPQFSAKKYIESKNKIRPTMVSKVEGDRSVIDSPVGSKNKKGSTGNRKPAYKSGSQLHKKKLRRQVKIQRNNREKSTLNTENFGSKKFTINDIKFEKVDNFYAISPEDYLPNNYEKVQELNGLFIVKYDGEMPDGSLAIVKNGDTNNLAVFTGILRVKLKDFDQASDLIDLVNEGIVSEDQKIEANLNIELQHIRVGSYQFSDYEDTMFTYDILQTEPFKDLVERVNIDLIEWKRNSN